MKLSDFDYPLPKELIAQRPLEKRDSSRLLVVHRKNAKIEDRFFSDLPEYIQAGDSLVLNDTRVFKARVLGKKKNTGGKVDILLLEPYVRARPAAPLHEGKNIWRCLIQPSPKESHRYVFGDIETSFIGRDTDTTSLVEFDAGFNVRAWAERVGTMPLPPYIKREANEEDARTYQTVYASSDGAVAAPTAGLHFTKKLLDQLEKKGVHIRKVTLHVGIGTFKPVEDLESHKMHSEEFELSAEAADSLNMAKHNGKKIWAVGTTTLRVLETCVRSVGAQPVAPRLVPGKGETDLFIKPPFDFETVDHLVTNFHLPKTTLLLLVSAFMGEALRKEAYRHALDKRYRFYSYGDAMLII